MKELRLIIDDQILERIDQLTRKLHITRSGFAREALRSAVAKAIKDIEKNQKIELLEEQHRQGYKKFPMTREESQLWEDEDF